MIISAQAVFFASEIVLPTDIVIIKVVDGVLSYSNTACAPLREAVAFPQVKAGGGIIQNRDMISSPLQTPTLLSDYFYDYDSYYSDYS